MTQIEKRNAELATLRNYVNAKLRGQRLDLFRVDRVPLSIADVQAESIKFFRLGFAAASAVLNGDCILGCHEKATVDGVCQTCHEKLFNSEYNKGV